MSDDPIPPASDRLLEVLGRIEEHLARIARVAETMSNAPVSFQKELGPVRTMAEPRPR